MAASPVHVEPPWPPIGASSSRLPGPLREELSRALQALIRIRLFSLVLTLGLAVIFAVWDPEPWKLGLLALTAAGHVIFTMRDLRRLPAQHFNPVRFLYVIGVVHGVYTVLTVVTGGIYSPMVIGFVGTTTLGAVTAGRLGPWLWSLVPPALVVWGLALGQYFGWIPYLVPPFLQPVGQLPSQDLLGTLGTAMGVSLSSILGGMVVLMVRQSLDHAVGSAVQARQEAVQAMRDRNNQLVEVAEAVAHELKNPLASIRGLSVLVARHLPAEGKASERMEVLQGEVRRMEAILNELFSFARPVRRLSLTAVDPVALAQALVSAHEGVARERGVHLSLEARETGWVSWDEDRVKQLLANLLQNALDATPPGGRVRVCVAPDGPEAVSFAVEDSGVGLADEVRGRLFTPGATTKLAGSGLGLTIARSIAFRHGGALSLDERPEGGCRASFRLPNHPPEAALDLGDAP